MYGAAPSNLQAGEFDNSMLQRMTPNNIARIGAGQLASPSQALIQEVASSISDPSGNGLLWQGPTGTNMGPPKTESTASNVIGTGLQVLSGVTSLASQWDAQQAPARAIQTNAPAGDTNAFGKPEYNLGAFMAETTGIQPFGATGGEIANGALTGAATGFAVGGPIGAAVGGLVGGLSSIFGGESREDEMKRKKELAIANIRTAQKQYNAALKTYDMTQTAKESYYNMVNSQKGAQNLYRYNNAV